MQSRHLLESVGEQEGVWGVTYPSMVSLSVALRGVLSPILKDTDKTQLLNDTAKQTSQNGYCSYTKVTRPLAFQSHFPSSSKFDRDMVSTGLLTLPYCTKKINKS